MFDTPVVEVSNDSSDFFIEFLDIEGLLSLFLKVNLMKVGFKEQVKSSISKSKRCQGHVLFPSA